MAKCHGKTVTWSLVPFLIISALNRNV